ncbi:glycosyltransferase family 2 protein [Flavobacterium sp. TMP13]|uniref:glycosyltransferase family 2 protein n=1 Tax=Flavobacterium sp. TMP13 TaxID=3425950 RepID=UPI003D789E7C
MANVTIIIPSYNHSNFLLDRLKSIANQTYSDWEAIIIDDKSTDCSVKLITNFIEGNTNFKVKHFIINEKNSGSGYLSWQKGIELAETQYIWIAETDDVSDNIFLESQIKLLEKFPEAALVFSNSQYIDENGLFLYTSEKRTEKLKNLNTDYNELKASILITDMPFETLITNGSSVVFRKSSDKIPESIFNNKQCSDIFLWTYLVKDKTFIFNNLTLNYFRRHDNSTTTLSTKYKLKSIYIEKFHYLNYFSQTDKVKLLLKHYIQDYIFHDKSEWFINSIFKEIESLKKFKFYFYIILIKEVLNKIYNKCHIKAR